MRSYRVNVRSRAAAIALGIAVVGVGIVVISFGIALLVGVAVVAFVLAGGAMLLRKIFGRRPAPPVRRAGVARFDPSLEVFPPETHEVPPPVREPEARPDRTLGGDR